MRWRRSVESIKARILLSARFAFFVRARERLVRARVVIVVGLIALHRVTIISQFSISIVLFDVISIPYGRLATWTVDDRRSRSVRKKWRGTQNKNNKSATATASVCWLPPAIESKQ